MPDSPPWSSALSGRTGREVSVVGLGTWQLGADWGEVSEDDALAVLAASVEDGVTFFDTADVYGDGRSEQVIGRFLRRAPGRHGRDQDGPADGPGAGELHAGQLPRLDRPLAAQPRRRHARPGAAALPAERGDRGGRDVRRPRRPGRRRRDRGVRRERRDRRPGARRDRAAERGVDPDHPQRVPAQAARRGAAGGDRGRRRDHRAGAAGVGLLSGKYDAGTTFAADDHRTYNRHGEAFDVGETFSGVDYETGVQAAKEFTALVQRERSRRDARAGRDRVARPAARRLDGDPRRPQRRPGPGQRGRGRGRSAAGRGARRA